MRRLALAALAAILTACSAGVGGDWPNPPKGILADCQALGDRCGGTGYCGATEDDRLTCCPVPLRDGVYCPGTAPGMTDCVTDADCPDQDCRDEPACLGGKCFAPVQAVRTYCSTGACDASGACVPCQVDADCEAVNHNECYHLVCQVGGTCTSKQMSAGEQCNFTDGICNEGAACQKH